MSAYTNQFLHEEDQKYYLPTFRRFPLALSHGKGSRVWDVEGNEYIDALAGIAVNNVGHAHPAVVKAIQEQAARLTHISNFFVSPQQVELSRKLVELSGIDRVFLTNSGAESLEGAIKIARKYAHSQGRGGTIISFENSFHGRTMATIATGQSKYQQGFEPIPTGFEQVPFNDIDAVRNVVSDETAAILLEPIQGEGGINMADREFLEALRELCDEQNIVLIFDEVQCGVGRTGHWFAKDFFGVQPDIMTLAKGLGGGVPIGAVMSNEKVSNAINFGDHGTTFGGNPLVCAASLATIRVIEDEGLLEKVRQDGAWLREQIEAMNEPSVQEIKGTGLMIGVRFEFETKPLVLDMLKNGVIANATAGNILRLVPPLNISRADLSEVLRVLKASLKTMKHHA
jgi:acetylornithine/N-succinyldiaminopimelate aminotransferase